ncbi:hypothetical protein HanXRQr2_Chr07g0306521 [Helianthus annuus]|uniref:Uncharacterized protein n=1 Tax=Helianthus annuus TaxID=4232 RepID=A0A251UCS2_HELAN|nr:hypothetical protein HanXRQr2_Chr07g0306521 [Helianthus annuus]KAJ0492468.1 hypothetical protein HanIR_Chr12g0575271 [Helianthus annuus]KAJ0819780.1 hypothetical protein HanPSC8_Chr16g0700001 [Helianthus annuus]KAJ0929611.1 hypothetical protein HanPSC8_Chr04g0139641 [Helianthus annuus]
MKVYKPPPKRRLLFKRGVLKGHDYSFTSGVSVAFSTPFILNNRFIFPISSFSFSPSSSSRCQPLFIQEHLFTLQGQSTCHSLQYQ